MAEGVYGSLKPFDLKAIDIYMYVVKSDGRWLERDKEREGTLQAQGCFVRKSVG